MKKHLSIFLGILFFVSCSPPPANGPGLLSTTAQVSPTVPAPAEMQPETNLQKLPENLVTFDEAGFGVGFNYPEGFIQGFEANFNGTYEPVTPYDLSYPPCVHITFNNYPGGSGYTINSIRVYKTEDINALQAGAIEGLFAIFDGQLDHHSDFPRLAGAGSIIDAQLLEVEFQNGRGYRYLVKKAYAAEALQDSEITYMYQGITEDERYFVSLVMSVNAPFLEAYIKQSLNTTEEFSSYFQTINNLVESSAGNEFSPSITTLDALVNSLIISQK